MNYELGTGSIDVAFFVPTKGRKPGTRNQTGEANEAAAKAGAALVRSSKITLIEAARTIRNSTRVYIGDTRLARLISAELANNPES